MEGRQRADVRAPRSGTAAVDVRRHRSTRRRPRSDRGPASSRHGRRHRRCPLPAQRAVGSASRTAGAGAAGLSRADRTWTDHRGAADAGSGASRTRPPRLTLALRPPDHGIARIGLRDSTVGGPEGDRRLAPCPRHRQRRSPCNRRRRPSAMAWRRGQRASPRAGPGQPPSPRRGDQRPRQPRFVHEHRPPARPRRIPWPDST